MKNCEQAKNQNILEHGISVKKYLFDLLNHLRTDEPLKYAWILPKFVKENSELLLQNMPDDNTLELYTTYHDCGKPFCVQIDDDGTRHFPNHAKVSYEYFKNVFDNEVAAELILHDMDIHNLKANNIKEFAEGSHTTTLLLTGLAEIHSNAKMFGGQDSISFKIKHKHISKKGEQIIRIITSSAK